MRLLKFISAGHYNVHGRGASDINDRLKANKTDFLRDAIIAQRKKRNHLDIIRNLAVWQKPMIKM